MISAHLEQKNFTCLSRWPKWIKYRLLCEYEVKGGERSYFRLKYSIPTAKWMMIAISMKYNLLAFDISKAQRSDNYLTCIFYSKFELFRSESSSRRMGIILLSSQYLSSLEAEEHTSSQVFIRIWKFILLPFLCNIGSFRANTEIGCNNVFKGRWLGTSLVVGCDSVSNLKL